jgi:hypothetical protein
MNEYLSHTADPDHFQQTGVVGAYRLNLDSAEIKAVDFNNQPAHCFVWDTDLLSPVLRQGLHHDVEPLHSASNNRLTLLEASLEAPDVSLIYDQAVLTVSPRFKLEWATEAFASQLGLVQLVESSRTLQLEDGDTVVLLDSETAAGGPVLYLNDLTDTLAVKPVCAFQPQGGRQSFDFNTEISQTIPAAFQGKPVASVSVLEKYTLYFMQNAAPEDPARHIWVPVHLPVVWGWSIRVQQRFDGVWDIFRKKLIQPAPTTEAPALPRWQSNTLRCFSSAGSTRINT